MSFRLTTVLWVFVVVSAALAAFGTGGLVAAGLVVAFWWWVFNGPRFRGNTLATVLSVVAVIVFLLFLLLPAVQSAREASSANQCRSNLKQIALALQTYHDVHGHLPPPYIADAHGKPIHSWRVLILPYIEEQTLYRQYKFDEPWDGPNNRKLAKLIPEVFRCPSQLSTNAACSVETNYFAIVGPETAWPEGGDSGRKFRDFKDGVSMTLLLVEATGQSVNWMEPRDVSMDDAIAMLTGKQRNGHIHVSDGWITTSRSHGMMRNVALADGRNLWLGRSQFEDAVKSLITVAGRETYSYELEEAYGHYDHSDWEIKWNVVYALGVFVAVSLLPIAKLWSLKQSKSIRAEELLE
jgi:hypothetical protein